VPACVSGPLVDAYNAAAQWIKDAISVGIDTGIDKSKICCNLGTTNLGNNCQYTTQLCLHVKSGSKIKAGTNSGLSVKFNFEVQATIDASCGRTFTAEKAEKHKIYDHKIYDVTGMVGFSATFSGGLFGKVIIKVPGTIEAKSSGRGTASIGTPSLYTEGGATVSASANAYVGLQGTAMLIASVSGKAYAQTSGYITICNGGVQRNSMMTAGLEGSYSVSVPSITLAAGVCNQAIAFNMNFQGLGGGYTKNLFSKQIAGGRSCPAPGTGFRSGGGKCYNNCHYASDGDCDDGGPGSEYSACSRGYDCYDCGPR